jgi:hypothetical protein
MSHHDRRADSQFGSGGTAHQEIVLLYLQRPVAGPKVVQHGSVLAEDADDCEIFRTLQRVRSLRNTVFDPLSPVLIAAVPLAPGLSAAGGMARPESAVGATNPVDTAEGGDLWMCCGRGGG